MFFIVVAVREGIIENFENRYQVLAIGWGIETLYAVNYGCGTAAKSFSVAGRGPAKRNCL